MTKSPLQLAHQFARLKSQLSSQPTADSRLLTLYEFWSTLKPNVSGTAYKSYLDEYISLFIHNLSEHSLHDLLPDELNSLIDLTQTLKELNLSSLIEEQLIEGQHLLSLETARKLFYVGSINEGLVHLARAISQPETTIEIPEDKEQYSTLDLLIYSIEKLKNDHPELSKELTTIANNWTQECDALSHDSAWSLFVEKDSFGNNGRGRLCQLKGSVEKRKKSATNDELTFESQLKSPDDPLVGTLYDGFETVRKNQSKLGTNKPQLRYLHGHFSIELSAHTYSGDSIGLAASLITYAQLLKPEVLRHEKYLSGEVAFTGGIDNLGNILAVDAESLKLKLKRAFFSHIKFVVLPDENIDSAKVYLNSFQQEYPNRRLIITGVSFFNDLIEDLNIVRAEKVCIGEFVARKAYKYSHATKVQIPLLIGLMYLLVCILFPKAWIGFDWNPQYVQVTQTGFEALNTDSVSLWEVEYDCENLTASHSRYSIGDIDSDSKNEIIFSPNDASTSTKEMKALFYVYNDNGKEMFHRSGIIFGKYPKDSVILARYPTPHVKIIKDSNNVSIISTISQSMPSRTHIKFWSNKGDSLGWYINSGSTDLRPPAFSSEFSNGFIFTGINNRTGSGCLFILPKDSVFGVSPPYNDLNIDLSWVIRGNQSAYIIFPRSDYCKLKNIPYNGVGNFSFISKNQLIVTVLPDYEDEYNPNIRYLLGLSNGYRVTKVEFDDRFRQLRELAALRGELPQIEWEQYADDLLNNVTYWTDSGWVTEGQLRTAGQ